MPGKELSTVATKMNKTESPSALRVLMVCDISHRELFRGPSILVSHTGAHTCRYTYACTHTYTYTHNVLKHIRVLLTAHYLILSTYTQNPKLSVSLLRLLHISCPMSSKQKTSVSKCCEGLWIVSLQRSKWTLL